MNVAFPPTIDLPFLVGVIALVAAGLAFFAPSALRRSALGRTLISLRLPALALGAVLVVAGFFTPTPETRLPNPIPRTVDSISVGRDVYLSNCSACHGADARGGGPLADTTPVRPPALAGPGSHLGQHTDGDLHYLIANGTSTGMPAWAGTLTDEQIWHVINFLRDLDAGTR